MDTFTPAPDKHRPFADRLGRIVWAGLIPLLLAGAFGPSTAPVYVGLLAFAYAVAWLVLALFWVFLRFFAGLQFSLRALLFFVVSIQIPIVLLATTPILVLRIVGAVLLFAWGVAFACYVAFVYRSRSPD